MSKVFMTRRSMNLKNIWSSEMFSSKSASLSPWIALFYKIAVTVQIQNEQVQYISLDRWIHPEKTPYLLNSNMCLRQKSPTSLPPGTKHRQSLSWRA